MKRDDSCESGVESPTTICASLVQLFSGFPLPAAGRLICTGCSTELTEGSTVTVHASQCVDHHEWRLNRWYCAECAPTEITAPTLGCTDVLIAASLGALLLTHEQHHQLCLTAVNVVAVIPPDEGDSY